MTRVASNGNPYHPPSAEAVFPMLAELRDGSVGVLTGARLSGHCAKCGAPASLERAVSGQLDRGFIGLPSVLLGLTGLAFEMVRSLPHGRSSPLPSLLAFGLFCFVIPWATRRRVRIGVPFCAPCLERWTRLSSEQRPLLIGLSLGAAALLMLCLFVGGIRIWSAFGIYLAAALVGLVFLGHEEAKVRVTIENHLFRGSDRIWLHGICSQTADAWANETVERDAP